MQIKSTRQPQTTSCSAILDAMCWTDQNACARYGLTGLAGPVLRAATCDKEGWIARFSPTGRKTAERLIRFAHDTLVNIIRNEIPQRVVVLVFGVLPCSS